MLIMTIEVNGYPIDFSSSFGVCLDPRRGYDLSNPEFHKAVRMAMAVWQDFRECAPSTVGGAEYNPKPRKVAEEFQAYRDEFVQWLMRDSRETAAYIQEQEKIRAAKRAEEEAKKRSGFVYLLKKEDGIYKIGKAVKPDARGAEFSVKLPFDTQYECVIAAADRHKLEAELHKRFSSKRINGEWFALIPEDVEYIKSLAVQS